MSVRNSLSLCNVIYTLQVLDKFKLSAEKPDDYCLWEMIGDGDQMTGKVLWLSI